MTLRELKKLNPEILYGEKWGRGYCVNIKWPEGYHGEFHYPPSTTRFDGNMLAINERMHPLGWVLSDIGVGNNLNARAHVRLLAPIKEKIDEPPRVA
ncbi:MAG: hypothetical protein KDB07_10730 [Planctomycetes bacterium]|nr:hypothetical protein [Planctomycetota bacterium]